MFTGLIEEIGRLSCVEAHGRTAHLTIAASSALVGDLNVGDSVAVDGACLTVERTGGGQFVAFASEETLARTTLGEAGGGRAVNLERALRVGDRLGGHFVAGHVDATGELLALDPRDGGWLLRVAAPKEILAVSVPKGSIAVDGINEPDNKHALAVLRQAQRNVEGHARIRSVALDRGFLDGKLLSAVEKDGILIYIPSKSNMNITKDAREIARRAETEAARGRTLDGCVYNER